MKDENRIGWLVPHGPLCPSLGQSLSLSCVPLRFTPWQPSRIWTYLSGSAAVVPAAADEDADAGAGAGAGGAGAEAEAEVGAWAPCSRLCVRQARWKHSCVRLGVRKKK
jgi:hypothetical protein